MTTTYKPAGHSTVTPYLVVANAAAQVEFLKKAFGAREDELLALPDGTVVHAQVWVHDCLVMIGQAGKEYPPMQAMLYVYVEDTDAAYQACLAAGAASVSEPKDQYYGDRNAGVRDPNGNQWWLGTHMEDVSPEEIGRHAAAQGRA